jgi:hypothetical protein
MGRRRTSTSVSDPTPFEILTDGLFSTSPAKRIEAVTTKESIENSKDWILMQVEILQGALGGIDPASPDRGIRLSESMARVISSGLRELRDLTEREATER